MAKELNVMFIETSAKAGANVKKVGTTKPAPAKAVLKHISNPPPPDPNQLFRDVAAALPGMENVVDPSNKEDCKQHLPAAVLCTLLSCLCLGGWGRC